MRAASNMMFTTEPWRHREKQRSKSKPESTEAAEATEG
jgi:hypothetical protein